MKILLSAFACDPNEGSEAGVGWSWAFHLAKAGHEVCVLTRSYHRAAIERKMCELDLPHLRFEYVDVRSVPFWMPGPGVYPYYICWQWNAYFRARQHHVKFRFDIVHHVSYGVFRVPSYLYMLGIPFIFGPVGGGECAPRALRLSMSRSGRRHETLRDLANLLPHVDPFWRSMLQRPARIVVKTGETRACLPKNSRERAVVALENMVSDMPYLAGETHRVPPLKLLYAGNLFPLKGVHLAIRAIARLRNRVSVRFTIVGKGPEERRLKEGVARLGLEKSVVFSPWMARTGVLALHATHDALLFPSLHDSSGTVVLEALSHGRPVICLDLGGPPVTVDDHCARIVPTRGRSEGQVIEGIGDAILELAKMSDQEWENMRRAAVRRAEFYTPDKVIARVYGPLLSAVGARS